MCNKIMNNKFLYHLVLIVGIIFLIFQIIGLADIRLAFNC